MDIKSFYPVLIAPKIFELKEFYCRYFGFTVAFEADWYVSLKKTQADQVIELALVAEGHPTIPPSISGSTRALILNIEVDDAKEAHQRLVGTEKLKPVLTLRDEAFGQRHFIIQDPAGNLVDVIQNIEPSAEFLQKYASEGNGA